MSVFDRWQLYPARVGEVVIAQIGLGSLSPNAEKAEIIPAGMLDRAFVGTAFAEPSVRFRTGSFLSLFGGGGKEIKIDVGYAHTTTDPTAYMQVQRRVDGGTLGVITDVEHRQFVSTKGFVCVDSVVAEQDSKTGAIIELLYYALSPDGITNPLSFPAASALNGTPAFDSIHFLGPVWIGDPAGSPNKLKSVQKVEVRPGIKYQVKRDGGEPFAVIGSIVQRMPEIRINLSDPNEIYSRLTPDLFGFNVNTFVNCYFQKGVQGGRRVANATAQHERLYASTAEGQIEGVSAQDQDDGTVDLVIRPMGTMGYAHNVTIPT
jgi:hypothetical protein